MRYLLGPMNELELRSCFAQVQELVTQEGVVVHLRGRILSNETSVNGRFTPPCTDTNHRSWIEIFRKTQSVPGDAMMELSTLAHEAGHYSSYKHGTRTAEYEIALDNFEETPDSRSLVQEDKQDILREELRAWHLGWEWLLKAGFSDRQRYDAHARIAIGVYMTMLGVTVHDLPADLVESAPELLATQAHAADE